MTHNFRLLNMAEGIAIQNTFAVYREDRELLLSIKNGEKYYEELVSLANNKLNKINLAFDSSSLESLPEIYWL
ncbi:MAG: hypothetical protein ACI8ZX_000606 [Planctomycetota bacterium]|jgi:hypothetical protein